MIETGQGIDWGMGELLAYASLLHQKYMIRLSGQDVCRGTFSHRQALWVDQAAGAYLPLSHISETQGRMSLYNSSLSEYAVLGFEFGYSLIEKNSLVIWEAQFGDFANCAQVMIDQYIVSSEQKWDLCSSITLLLPHGYEGQGPEHSSARVERFLQLCGHNNIQVVNCTTPAQLFHLLRRQAIQERKKPLVLFTPKALLRHPLCKSSFEEFHTGQFQPFLDDPAPPQKAKRLILCTGKVFYDLLEEREKRKKQQHRNCADRAAPSARSRRA